MAILIDRTSTFEKSTIIPQYMVGRDGVVPLLLLAFAWLSCSSWDVVVESPCGEIVEVDMVCRALLI